jgi:hypothetical protein
VINGQNVSDTIVYPYVESFVIEAVRCESIFVATDVNAKPNFGELLHFQLIRLVGLTERRSHAT